MNPAQDSAIGWTRPIPAAAAEGSVAALYGQVKARSSRGAVGHFWQALGIDSRALEALLHQAKALIDEPAPLTAAQTELIALVVSATNGCGYCVAHHGPRLARALGDEALARAVALDYREANLTARDRVLLDYTVALTCEPSERKLEDVDRLREYGFDDPAIVRATAVTALFNHVNRVASALGVTLEVGVHPWEFGSQR
jgi:uncharacterized peroxidase-related enzyme